MNLGDCFIKYTTFFEGRSILGVFGATTGKTGDDLNNPTPHGCIFSSILTIFAVKSAVNVELRDHMDCYDSSN